MSIIRRDPSKTRVVITGMGTINPIAHTVPQFWENLLKGKSGIRTIQQTDISESPVKIGGEVDYPDNINDYIPKKMMRRLERFIMFGQYAGSVAFQDSGIPQEMVDKDPSQIWCYSWYW